MPDAQGPEVLRAEAGVVDPAGVLGPGDPRALAGAGQVQRGVHLAANRPTRLVGARPRPVSDTRRPAGPAVSLQGRMAGITAGFDSFGPAPAPPCPRPRPDKTERARRPLPQSACRSSARGGRRRCPATRSRGTSPLVARWRPRRVARAVFQHDFAKGPLGSKPAGDIPQCPADHVIIQQAVEAVAPPAGPGTSARKTIGARMKKMGDRARRVPGRPTIRPPG